MSLVNQKKRIVIIVCAIVLLIGVVIIAARILSPAQSQQQHTESVSAPTASGDLVQESGNGSQNDHSFNILWQEYSAHRNSLAPDEFTRWFEEWKVEQSGKYVEGRSVYRGRVPATNTDSSTPDSVFLIFRPATKNLRQSLRIKCLANKNNQDVESLRLDDEVILKGEISSIAGETSSLEIDTLPYGAVLTVFLEDAEFSSPND